jgi:predicted metal-dependent phosphoesterase TrpH
VWAHPFWDVAEDAAVLDAIDRYREAGLDGVECFYVTHDERQTRLLVDRCTALGLLSTASSDFHGPDHRLFSRFLAYGLYDREPQLGALAGG